MSSKEKIYQLENMLKSDKLSKYGQLHTQIYIYINNVKQKKKETREKQKQNHSLLSST